MNYNLKNYFLKFVGTLNHFEFEENPSILSIHYKENLKYYQNNKFTNWKWTNIEYFKYLNSKFYMIDLIN